jgi:hypothetical protein
VKIRKSQFKIKSLYEKELVANLIIIKVPLPKNVINAKIFGSKQEMKKFDQGSSEIIWKFNFFSNAFFVLIKI